MTPTWKPITGVWGSFPQPPEAHKNPFKTARYTLQLGAIALLLAAAPAAAQEAAVSQSQADGDDHPEDFAQRGGQPGDRKLDGRLSLRDIVSVDSQTDNTLHFNFLDADLRGQDLTQVGGGHLNLRLDSRLLLDWTQNSGVQGAGPYTDDGANRKRNERRFGETQTWADIRMLYVELAGLGSLDVRVGRAWFAELGGAWVDGAALTYHLNPTWTATAFGGLQPHPYTWGLAFNRQSLGAFAAAEGQRGSWSLGYNLNLYEGSIDRHYLGSRGQWAVPWEAVKGFFLSYYTTLDLQGDEAPRLTTAFANASLWANDTLNFGVHGARFSNITYQRSSVELGRDRAEDNQRPLLGDTTNAGTYNQLRLSAAQRFGTTYLYQQLDLRQRDILDQRDAAYYHVGVREQDLLGTGLFLHARLTVRNNFAADSSQLMLEFGKLFGSSFELNGAFVYLTGRSLLSPQRQDVFIYNLSGLLNFTPAVYMSLDYELNQETNIIQEELETSGDLLIHTLFTRLTYRL